MTRMLSLDLAISKQGHVLAVATSPDEFPARSDVRSVCLDGFGSVVAVINRADVAHDDFVGGHDKKLPMLVFVLYFGIDGVSPCPSLGVDVDRCLRLAARRRGTSRGMADRFAPPRRPLRVPGQ